MINFVNKAKALTGYTQALRRDFHMHPELGFEEIRTAGIIAKELRTLDLEVTTGVAETGVVALLEGGKPDPFSCSAVIWMPSPSQKKQMLNTHRKNPKKCTPAGMMVMLLLG